MANQTAWKRDTPGLTLYAYPLSQNIADWATYAVTFTEKGDGGGWYSATLDDTYTDWAIFDTVPSSWDESLYSSISLEAEAGAADAADGIPYYPTVRRNADDENPIVFSWPSSTSLTAQVSLNGGAFAAVAGTIAVVAEVETGLWKYQLSFDAADRPSTGVAEYAITDGTDTVYMPLSMDTGGSAHTAEDVRNLILAGDQSPIDVDTGRVNNVMLVDTTTDLTNQSGGSGSSGGSPRAF